MNKKKLFLLLIQEQEKLDDFHKQLDDCFNTTVELPIDDICYDIMEAICLNHECYEIVDSWLSEAYFTFKEGGTLTACDRKVKCPYENENGSVNIENCKLCEEHFEISSYEELYDYLKDSRKE